MMYEPALTEEVLAQWYWLGPGLVTQPWGYVFDRDYIPLLQPALDKDIY